MGNNDSKRSQISRHIPQSAVEDLATRLAVKSEADFVSQQSLFDVLEWNKYSNSLPEQVWVVISRGAKTSKFSSILDFVDAAIHQDLRAASNCTSEFFHGAVTLDNAKMFCHNLLQLFQLHRGSVTNEWLNQGIPVGGSEAILSPKFLGSLKNVLESVPEDEKGDVFLKWFQREPLLFSIQTIVLCHLFNQPFPSDIVPQPTSSIKSKPVPTILDLTDVMFINQNLPQDLRSEWELIYSTRTHGLSFTSLLSRITNKGPTIIIIKDSQHHIFGGFASESWRLGPKFIGNIRCFLFKLRPGLSTHTATGYNDHYMYLNIQQQTMPNGLGMGGQLGNFGFWIDADFGKGHCCAGCSTYHHVPTLSSEREFTVEHIEVWAVGPPPKEESDEETGGKRSILDKDSGAKALLELVDRGHHSEGIREVPDEDY